MLGVVCTVSIPAMAKTTKTISEKINHIHNRLQGHDQDIAKVNEVLNAQSGMTDGTETTIEDIYGRLARLCEFTGHTQDQCDVPLKEETEE